MTPEEQERHKRNQKALAYLDMLKEADERNERAKCRLYGCLVVILFNIIFWYAVYCGIQKLGEL